MWAEVNEGATCQQSPIPRVAAENPIMHKHAREQFPADLAKPHIVQPWWFGERAFKATGFYLHGLAELVPMLTSKRSGPRSTARARP